MTRASGCLVTGCTLLSLLLPAGPARAQGLDVTGSWSVRIQTTVSIGVGRPVPLTCGFQGTTTVNQAGSRFSGEIDVNQASGPGSCPSAMSATLTGDVTGNQVSMGAVMGNPSFGAASFTGTLTSAVAPGSTMSGTFTVTGGPFTGTSGTWNATKLAAVAAVPALGGWGLALLAAVLLGCSLWLLRRMPAPRPR